jgi:peptide/nickel transport system substrate-binding protein
LRLSGPRSVDRLDPVAAPPHAQQLVRLLSRQLLTYEPRRDLREWQAVAPVPDVAVAVPSTYNAGLGASHRSHVIHLRPGVLWDTSPPRPVTAHDFVRGFKRLANPVARPAALAFFRSTIRAFAEFCDGFADAVPAATATADRLAAYQAENEIPGVFALDDESLVIEIVRPSPDFVHVLALGCASASPIEHDAFLPGSPELTRNLRSNGPYRVSRHVPGRELRLERNPVWDPSSDPVRHRHVEAIEVVVDEAGAEVDRAASPWGFALRHGVEAAAADLSWDLDPYLALNVAAGNPALRNVRVRRALAAAIDKSAVASVHHDRAAVRVASSIVPPNNDGHQPDLREPAGDPAAARGLELILVYERADATLARACAAGLSRAEVSVHPVELAHAEFDRLVADPSAASWDVVVHRRSAAWHYRNARVFLEAMFATGSPANLGGFSDPETDGLIRRALDAATEAPAVAAAAWHAVERRVLEQAAIVPVVFRAPTVPLRTGAGVRDALPMPALGFACDLASVRLDDASSNGAATGRRILIEVGAP